MRLTTAALCALLLAAPPPMGRPVFDCYHINRAWGFFLGGTVIDDRGQMFAYRTVDRNAMPAEIAEGGRVFYDAATLLSKFQNRTPNGHVDRPMLDEQMALVQRAADGRVDLRDGRARDAGVSSCHAYVPDPETHRVRDVPLGSYGAVNDRVITNSSDAAATLLGWLKAVRAAQ